MTTFLAIVQAFELPNPAPDLGPLAGMFSSTLALVKSIAIVLGLAALIFAIASWFINFRNGHNPTEAFSTLIWIAIGIALVLFAAPIFQTMFSGSWG
jgi:uncharacterized membrane protein YidH (DUF202 family)